MQKHNTQTRINLIAAQAKQIEAILGDIVEREGAQDMFQGGYTAGMEVAGRAFVVFTALGWRLRIDKVSTYTCCLDMPAFFSRYQHPRTRSRSAD